jgi:25S rRNA (uracil2634-N3)-methyltransferase
MKVKYSKAESNIAELKRLGTRILHGVDVNTMKIHTELKGRWFDQVIFNFPHAGFKGREDQVHLIKYVHYLFLFLFSVDIQLNPGSSYSVCELVVS